MCAPDDPNILKTKKLFLFDMDGTIYSGDHLFDGSKQLFEYLEQSHKHYVFITNNSSKSVNEYIKKINDMGIKATADNFLTSTQLSISFINDNYPSSNVYCLGTKSFINELKNGGINIVDSSAKSIDLVLIGFDTELTYEKIRKTCNVLFKFKDIPLYGTNCDYRCPVEWGFIPDCGAICEMIYRTTNRKAIFLGKPEPIIIDTVSSKFNVAHNDIVVIGDRLYTDIATGYNAGVTTVCLLSGEANTEEIAKSNIKPSFVFENIMTLHKTMFRSG